MSGENTCRQLTPEERLPMKATKNDKTARRVRSYSCGESCAVRAVMACCLRSACARFNVDASRPSTTTIRERPEERICTWHLAPIAAATRTTAARTIAVDTPRGLPHRRERYCTLLYAPRAFETPQPRASAVLHKRGSRSTPCCLSLKLFFCGPE